MILERQPIIDSWSSCGEPTGSSALTAVQFTDTRLDSGEAASDSSVHSPVPALRPSPGA